MTKKSKISAISGVVIIGMVAIVGMIKGLQDYRLSFRGTC